MGSEGVTNRKPQSKLGEVGGVESKRSVPDSLRRFLDWDAIQTGKLTAAIRNTFPNATKSETKFMEISGSGFVWLPLCALLYLLYPMVPKALSINLVIALLFDIVVIGLIKAFARRRRPQTQKADFFGEIGPDKFSFPSGHASRSVLLAVVFSQISPLFGSPLLQLAATVSLWAWALAVCTSRLVNGRHYLFDVVAGIFVGFVESFIVGRLWMSAERAENMLSFFSDDAPEDF